jgi:hypothetical protein
MARTENNPAGNLHFMAFSDLVGARSRTARRQRGRLHHLPRLGPAADPVRLRVSIGRRPGARRLPHREGRDATAAPRRRGVVDVPDVRAEFHGAMEHTQALPTNARPRSVDSSSHCVLDRWLLRVLSPVLKVSWTIRVGGKLPLFLVQMHK